VERLRGPLEGRAAGLTITAEDNLLRHVSCIFNELQCTDYCCGLISETIYEGSGASWGTGKLALKPVHFLSLKQASVLPSVSEHLPGQCAFNLSALPYVIGLWCPQEASTAWTRRIAVALFSPAVCEHEDLEGMSISREQTQDLVATAAGRRSDWLRKMPSSGMWLL
jgi:hypothetical protein